MRVLLMPHRYPPNARGGVETWAFELAHALAERGHAVAVLTRDDARESPLPPFSLVEGRAGPVQVWRIRHRHAFDRRFRDSWSDPRWVGPIETVLDVFRPDVVHVGHPDGWGVTPFRLATARGLVTGATLHDYKWICPRGQMVHPSGQVCEGIERDRCVACVADQLGRGPLRAAVAQTLHTVGVGGYQLPVSAPRKLVTGNHRPRRRPRRWRLRQRGLMRELEQANVVTSPSRFVAGRLREAGLRRSVDVIPNGLAVALERAPEASSAGPLRIGFFGNPLPSKGIDVLLAAFASLPPGAATLELHGPAPADVPGAPQGTSAHGAYAPDEAVQRMRRVHVVALPSLWDENQPIVALEARAAGRPLLVSDRGGLPELVRADRDGWILPAGDAEAWGERLALLCADRSILRSATAAVEPPSTAEAMAAAFERAWSTGTIDHARVDSDRPASGE